MDNNNIKDYARKVAKSSLDYDIAYNQKRVGKSDGRELKNLKEIFDGFCQSANFAACKRKPGEVAGGIGSLSELIMKVEMSGEIQKTKVVFPKDDVDRILKDFTHTLIAAGLDGESE